MSKRINLDNKVSVKRIRLDPQEQSENEHAPVGPLTLAEYG